MWSAFMNGSGLLHGGGGAAAGGGYVPSQGWEFVPGSGMERTGRGGRGKSRSPLRRISSPPAVFTQMYEPQAQGAGATGGGGEGGTGAAQLEVLRGQMWPCPGQQQQTQQQTQHTRLKKKFEDLKKRHTHDKEEWMREKESLLREVADIQGGENRRILLDLKTVLEEVQAEVKREEEKRSELQLLYTRDRCAWDLEKAELQCRIAQLEARERAAELTGGGVRAAGAGSVVLRNNQELRGETPTLRREREEQRRLLADTHTTAMDLRCRLEHNERDWSREKAELLERFDVERREWENQLKDMQKKIEELYCEVRVKRKGTGLDTGRQEDHRLSIRSTSTGSSLLSDNSHSEPLSSSSQSEPSRQPTLPSFGRTGNVGGGGGRDGHQSTCFQADSFCEFNVGGPFTRNDRVQAEPADDVRSRGCWEQIPDSKDVVDTSELEAIFRRAPGCGVLQKNVSEENEKNVLIDTLESPLWAELSYSSSKKKNIVVLNAALKEIARVSEELCSYQDDIRKKSGDKRIRSESLCLPEEREVLFGKNKTEPDEESCDLSQIYYDLRALETENWITLSPDNTWQASVEPDESWRMSTTDPDSCRDAQTSPDVLSETETTAPPIPPRSSSRNLNAPIHPDSERHITDSPMTTVRRCHSPCVVVDRKCSSPSIVRKFEAMLQENEGKVLVDGVIASCAVPTNPKCNVGCCHNRWSCDASKFTSGKSSAYGSVQKSYSEANILSAGRDLRPDYSPSIGNLQSPELQMPPIVKDLPVELILSSLEMPPASPSLHGSRRNIMLEQKTAEFNRTLFQAEMGRGVEEPDGFTATDACAVGCQPAVSSSFASEEVLLPRESRFQPHRTDVTGRDMDVHPEVALPPPTMYCPSQNPEVQLRQRRCGTEDQKVRTKQEVPSGLSAEVSHADLREAATASSHSHRSEVKHKASSPSRKSPHRAATETPFSEAISPGNTHPGQNVAASSSKNENPHGARPLPVRVGGSLQQTSAENKQRPTTQPLQAQPKHASVPPSPSDNSRPGPRIMTDHPWKPLTLAAYPRPEGSRSNYGAVERILKNYESAARAQQNQSQQSEKAASPNLSVKREGNTAELDMLDMHPPPSRHTQPSHTAHTHNTHTLLSSHSVMGMTEIQLTVQDKEESRFTSSSPVQKNFSRPARPANRRLPSRWASRSPTSSSSASSSPSTTPVIPPSFPPLQKHASSFTYSHAFHIETVII